MLNFADELSHGSREALKAQVAQVARQTLGVLEDVPVFCVSALAAKRGEDPSGEWPLLMGALEALAREGSWDRIRRTNAMGTLREIADRAQTAQAAREVAVEEIQRAFEIGWASAQRAVQEDFRARWRVSRRFPASPS